MILEATCQSSHPSKSQKEGWIKGESILYFWPPILMNTQKIRLLMVYNYQVSRRLVKYEEYEFYTLDL